MTALEQLAALRTIMGELAEIDSEGTLARQRFRLDPTSQLPPISPQADQFWRQFGQGQASAEKLQSPAISVQT
jgi:hypothetical protein